MSNITQEELEKMTNIEREELYDDLYEKAVSCYLEKTDFCFQDWLNDEDCLLTDRINFLNGENEYNPNDSKLNEN